MAVFSSAAKTTACCGGFKYRPITSAAFLLELWIVRQHVALESVRLIAGSAPDRATSRWLMSSTLANLRVVQWVLPSGGFWRVFASSRVSSAGVRSVSSCPRYFACRLARRSASNSCFHRLT